MIIDIQKEELRDFTYITSVYKCISNYNLMGHQIGRKIGDMLEILTMGAIYQMPTLKSHLDTEGKLEGFTTAGHKVEFGFYKDVHSKSDLFGAIECKCVGVEETKMGKSNRHLRKHLVTESFQLNFSPRWISTPITQHIKILAINTDSVDIELSNTKNSLIQKLNLKLNDNVKFVIDEKGMLLNTTPNGNMISEIPGIIRICKTIRLEKIARTNCTFALFDCLTGPQTIEKAKQASLVAMDIRRKIDGHWGKEDILPQHKKMTFIHVICEFSHWEEKSRNVIKTCIDHNLIVPDAIIIKAFETFEKKYGTAQMLDYISKNQYVTDPNVQSTVSEILNHFENHIFYDIATNAYVKFDTSGNDLKLITL